MSHWEFKIPKCPFHVIVFSIASIGALSVAYNHFTSKKKKITVPPELNFKTGYDKELKAALEIAIQAGDNILQALDQPKDIEQKGDVDFVTATDKSNEKMIFDFLKHKFPHHEFIGEESVATEGAIPQLSSKPTWIIDPIDGTTNFLHTFPFTCVSIGLLYEKIPVLGVVVAPALGEVYIGVKRHGAYLNGKRLSVSGAKKIKDSIILTELGYIRDIASRSLFLDCIQSVLNEVPHALRMMGSGVLALCYVASGRLDALYTGVAGEGWKPWDYCAGALFVEEAGGEIITLDKESFHIASSSCVAAASLELCLEIKACVNKVIHKDVLSPTVIEEQTPPSPSRSFLSFPSFTAASPTKK